MDLNGKFCNNYTRGVKIRELGCPKKPCISLEPRSPWDDFLLIFLVCQDWHEETFRTKKELCSLLSNLYESNHIDLFFSSKGHWSSKWVRAPHIYYGDDWDICRWVLSLILPQICQLEMGKEQPWVEHPIVKVKPELHLCTKKIERWRGYPILDSPPLIEGT